MSDRRAIFLDRDDTIIRDVGYLDDPDAIEFLPGALDGMRQLAAAGFRLILITNQSGIARGYFDIQRLEQIHARLTGLLTAQQLKLDAIYYCPHHVDGNTAPYNVACDCRKPAPGMLLRAAADHGIDLPASVMIGDKPADVGSGQAAGCRTIRIGVDAADLREAAAMILES